MNSYTYLYPSSTAISTRKYQFGNRFPFEDMAGARCSIPDLENMYLIIIDGDTFNQAKPQFREFCTETPESSIISKRYEPESPDIENELNRIFTSAKDEIFEDGIEVNFSRSLMNFILKYNELSIDTLSATILSNKYSSSIISEALRWIGKLDHPQTHYSRLNLLERCLFSDSYYIRDGAILGIEFLDDKNAIDTIKIAMEKENVPEIKKYMSQVIFYLQED